MPAKKSKKVLNPNRTTEQEGLIFVQKMALALKAIWRPTPNDDYGLDGELELTRDGAPTGFLVKAEVKSGPSYFHNRSASGFDFHVKAADADYWLIVNVPVILIVHDPQSGHGYWIDVKKYAAQNGEFPSTSVVRFSLRRNLLSAESIFELLEEPYLVFGGSTLGRDPKAGLAFFGPAGLDTPLHPKEIDIALIGTGSTLEAAQGWIEKCAHEIEGSPKKPRQVPPFPGFRADSPFKSAMRAQQATQGLITDIDVRNITSEPKYEDGFRKAVEMLSEKVTLSCESLPGARVVVCAIPQTIVDYCMEAGSYLRRHGSSNALFSKLLKLEEQYGQTTLFGSSASTQRPEDIVYRNLRRALKATTMKLRKPLQIALETSLFSARAQHPATKAWNFCVAQYYKATGALPWKLDGMDPNTCFVGISFFQQNTDTSFKMRTSLAQVFAGDGEAFVVRGLPFNWEQGKTPHLPRDGAEALMKLVIDRYKEMRGQPPQRIVIHKTSKFYEDEREGFIAGLGGVRRYDLVSIQKVGTRFFREGGYPPLRRTYAQCGNGHFLYTLGYIPELGTYPKGYVPEPWYLIDHHGDATPKRIFKEILALSKMNFNNVDFADGDPITTRFAQRIGEILAYIKEGDEDKHYRFYM